MTVPNCKPRVVKGDARHDVITPLAEALLVVAQVFSSHRLSTEAGAEKAARLLQSRLAVRGVYLHKEVQR